MLRWFNLTSQLDFKEAGEEGSERRQTFVHDLVQDMSNAAKVPSDIFAVKRLAPGSIVAGLEVSADSNGTGPSAQAVVADLKLQAADPDSILMHGRITRFTQNIVIVPATVLILARDIRMHVQCPRYPCLHEEFGCTSHLCNVFPILM